MKLTGLAALSAIIAISFFSLWWLNVIGTVGCFLLAAFLEHENDRLRAELAQYKTAPEPDHEPPKQPDPKAGDAFLQRLRRL